MDHRSQEPPAERAGDRVVVGIPEFIDDAVRDRVLDQVLAQLDGPVGEVVLDLSGAAFIDASGLGVLMAAHHRASESGRRITVVTDHPMVTRMLFLAGADQVFAILPSMAAALAPERERAAA